MRTRIVVRLKAPDPSVATVLVTLRRIAGEICPEQMQRYDGWEFTGPGRLDDTVLKIVDKYDDIVNPNKETYIFLQEHPLPGENPELVWVSVFISDRIDGSAESWLDILQCSGFEIDNVFRGVLWRLGFPEGTPVETAAKNARAISVTTDRKHGLLGNPISQEISIRADE